MANRDRAAICADILSVTLKEMKQFGGALKTHIMYKANLSHRQLERYIAELSESGMLLEVQDPLENGHRLYITTDKGIDFLKDYNKLFNYLKNPEIQTLPEIQVPLVKTSSL